MWDPPFTITDHAEEATPLHVATSYKLYELLQRLLKQDNVGEIIEKQWYGQTPLHHATLAFDVRAIKLLIEAGADTCAQDRFGRSVLTDSLSQRWRRGRSELNEGIIESVVNIFIEHGLDIHAKSDLGNTVLHEMVRDNLYAMKLFLKNGANVHEKDNSGKTPLHWAAATWEPERVKYLIEYGADVHSKDQFGQIALHCAVDIGDVAITQLLLERGSNVHASTIHGDTPLLTAAAVNDRQCCSDKVEPDMMPILPNRAPIVQMLLKNGADINARDIHRSTALHLLVMGSASSMRSFVKNGMDINAINSEKRTPLYAMHFFQREGDSDQTCDPLDLMFEWQWTHVLGVTKLLLEGRIDVNATDDKGLTALDYAKQMLDFGKVAEKWASRKAVIIQLLESAMADSNKPSMPTVES